MPLVHIYITDEGATDQQKEALIQGTTDLLVNVLNKDPATTFVIIEEVSTKHWGVAGKTVAQIREQIQRT